jgi:hypothetical protein
MEHKNADTVIVEFDLVYLFKGINYQFLNGLQAVHDEDDNWLSSNTMRAALREATGRCPVKLDTSILDTLSFKDR